MASKATRRSGDDPDAGNGASRGTARRDEILAVAADLFSAHGYPATGVDDIGEAVGITGPGLYRHFESKSAVLAEVISDAVEPLMAGVADIVERDLSPKQTLFALIDNVVDCMAARPASFAVLTAERQHLDRSTLRAIDRGHRLHLEEWTHVLCELHPSLSDAEARTVVSGIFGLTLAITDRHRHPPDPLVTETVRAMARHVAMRAGAAGVRSATGASAG